MKHFLTIDDLSVDDVHALLNNALYLKKTFKEHSKLPDYSKYAAANLFYEPSTRTRISFELAAKRLSINVVNLNILQSSETKGETIQDTIQTIASMGVDLIILRHHQNGFPAMIKNQLTYLTTHIINAGDGQNEHPSQAMLDLMTIIEKKPNLHELKIAIVGDVRHSRVANSLQRLFKLIYIKELVLIAPEPWHPEPGYYGNVTSSLEAGLENADVIIVLRIQRERFLEHETVDLEYYRQYYALTTENINMAKTNALIMHPGPINRGVEIDSVVADSSQSEILTQIQNGVYMRMAILEALLHS